MAAQPKVFKDHLGRRWGLVPEGQYPTSGCWGSICEFPGARVPRIRAWGDWLQTRSGEPFGVLYIWWFRLQHKPVSTIPGARSDWSDPPMPSDDMSGEEFELTDEELRKWRKE